MPTWPNGPWTVYVRPARCASARLRLLSSVCRPNERISAKVARSAMFSSAAGSMSSA